MNKILDYFIENAEGDLKDEEHKEIAQMIKDLMQNDYSKEFIDTFCSKELIGKLYKTQKGVLDYEDYLRDCFTSCVGELENAYKK